MYLLYLDASGNVLDPNEEYIIVAGVAIFERQTYYAVEALDTLAAEIDPHHPEEIEFHGSVMFQAREDWKRIGLGESRDLIASALGVLQNTHSSTHLFAAAIHKSAISPRESRLQTAISARLVEFCEALERRGQILSPKEVAPSICVVNCMADYKRESGPSPLPFWPLRHRGLHEHKPPPPHKVWHLPIFHMKDRGVD